MTPAASGARPHEPSAHETWFLVLLAATAIFRFLYSGWIPLSGDELMHWQWSRHLALGYPEHPPLIAWSIFAETSILGTSERSVRLVSVLAMTATCWLAFRLGKQLYGPRAAFYGAAALLMTPLVNAGGVIATTDALLSFLWMLTVYCVKRAVLDGRRGAWLAAGAAAGFGMLTKLPAAFLFPATAIVLAGTREGRPWLRRFEPYGAAAVSLLIFSPDIFWNARHGWITLTMRLGYGVPEHFTLRPFGELLTAQFITVTPILFPWILWGLAQCWLRRSDSRSVLLGAYMAVPFLFYMGYSLHAGTDIHWSALGYVTGCLAAGAFTAELFEPKPAVRFLSAAAVPAVALLAVLYAVPLAPSLVTFSWSYSRKLTTDRLNEVVDWRQLGEPIGRLLAQERGPSFILCRDGYAVAGLASFYTPGRPEVFLWEKSKRNGAAYDAWKREADLRGASAVIVDDLSEPGFIDAVRRAFDALSPPSLVLMKREGRVVRKFELRTANGFHGFPPDGR